MNEYQVTLNQLSRICEDKTWEDFEAMPDGRLVLMDHAQTLLPEEEPVSQFMWVFEMRIGTHFGEADAGHHVCWPFHQDAKCRTVGGYQLEKTGPNQT